MSVATLLSRQYRRRIALLKDKERLPAEQDATDHLPVGPHLHPDDVVPAGVDIDGSEKISARRVRQVKESDDPLVGGPAMPNAIHRLRSGEPPRLTDRVERINLWRLLEGAGSTEIADDAAAIHPVHRPVVQDVGIAKNRVQVVEQGWRSVGTPADDVRRSGAEA